MTPSSVFAQTTNTSAIGELEIHIFEPERRIAARRGAGARHHAAGVRAVIGLGQAEAADPFAGGKLRQVFLALRFRAVGEDREHDERALHAHHRAIARVDALDLARDEAVADVVESRARRTRMEWSRRGVPARPFRERWPDRSARGGTRRSPAAAASPARTRMRRRAPSALPRSAVRTAAADRPRRSGPWRRGWAFLERSWRDSGEWRRQRRLAAHATKGQRRRVGDYGAASGGVPAAPTPDEAFA